MCITGIFACLGACCCAVFSCCGRCCVSSSQCGMLFNRIFYLFMLLILGVLGASLRFTRAFDNMWLYRTFSVFGDVRLEVEETSEHMHLESAFWVFMSRMIFSYFIWHSIMLAFSFFAFCPGTVAIAKFAHRGVLMIKLPLLIGFFFLTLLFDNVHLANFQYVVYAGAAVATFLMAI